MATFAKNYGWAHLTVAFLGNASVEGVQQLTYTAEREREDIYGRGSKPHDIGLGNIKYTGEIKLTRAEILAIREAHGFISLVEISPFDIVVTYAKAATDPVKVEVLKGVTFLKDGTEATQGDKELPLTIPIGILNVTL